MVQCEMCGVETASPVTAKIEGAELEVCSDCAEFGTEVKTQSESSTTSKYSTSSTGSSKQSGTSGSSSSGSGGSTTRSRPRRDLFDEMDEIAEDFDQRIRSAREGAGLTQAELADQLNEKTSLIRKLERGEHLPSDTIRRKLERALDIELLEGGGGDEDANEWSGSSSSSGVTLGDVVKRKD